ncbi:MAG: hypothetical protein U0Q16_03625 [Bryobacteraceae bacterium]
MFKATSLAVIVLTVTPSVFSAPISVSSYDIPNGSGAASGGSFNYWDLAYTGSGSKTTDGAALTGGVGNLTDGVIPAQNWNLVENIAGTGPYVGWLTTNVPNVLLTFRFASVVTVNSITIYVDDSDFGGVAPPLGFDIGVLGGPSTNFSVSNPAGSAPTSYTFSGLNLVGNAIQIHPQYRAGWIFISEVAFDGPATGGGSIPEPTSGLLIAAGMLVAFHRSKQRKAS